MRWGETTVFYILLLIETPQLRLLYPQLFQILFISVVWHIMKKLKDKVSVELRSDENFLKRINYLVYNRDNEPHAFESEWAKLLFDYKKQKLDENVGCQLCIILEKCGFLLILDLFIWVVCLGLHQGQKVRLTF